MGEAAARTRRHFASDNWAGAHPEVLAALATANQGHAASYGDDDITARAVARIQALFGAPVAVNFVFNGTAANVLGLASALRPYQAVVCSDVAHLHVDECGAWEHLAGSKLLTVPTTDGKLTPELVASRITNLGVVHSVQPAAISITQSTEYGTVYSAAEIAALARLAREHGLLLHLDGARLANAAATLGSRTRRFHHRRRGRYPHLRRHQERPRRWRGGYLRRSRPRRRFRLRPQAGDAARVQDALRLRPVRGAPRG